MKHYQNSIWRFFIDNYRFTYFLLVIIIALGAFSIFSIPKESTPEIDFPIMVVSTVLPGASALVVEELVTNKIESRIQGVPDIDSMESVSSQGFSQIIVNFNVNTDGREKLSDTKEAVDRAIRDLPDDAGTPNVQQISFADRPILSMSLSGDYELETLKEYAENLQDDIERITSISGVTVQGAPDRAIEIILRQESLSQYNISLPMIGQSLMAANSDIPIGSIETAQTIYTVRLDGRLIDAEDVRNTPITSNNGVPIFIRDIATVQETQIRPSTVTRYGGYNRDSLTSVSLLVFKRSGEGDIISIVSTIKDRIESAYATYLPDDVAVEIIENDADLISSDLSQLVSSGAMTMLIVLLVLIVFLGWREAILASIVVPLTFLMTLFAIAQLGFTINSLTLFALILSLGILVDASIVVTESIFKNINDNNESPYEAVLHTISEFQKPLITGTLTTVFVFLPMLLIPGIIGKFIRPIPVTVSIVLISAIFASLAIITTLAVRFLPKKSTFQKTKNIAHRIIDRVYLWYKETLKKVLEKRSKRNIFLSVVSVLFIVAVSMPAIGLVQVNFFPSTPQSVIYIDVENPEGTPLAVTSAQLADIETLLVQDERVLSFLTTAGSASDAGSIGGNNSHKGSIVVRLNEDRNANSIEMISEYEQELPLIFPDIDAQLSQVGAGPPSGAPLQIRLEGDDLDDLYIVAQDIAEIVERAEGTRNVSSGITDSSGELLLTVNRPQARTYGVSPADIAGVLRTAISGSTATTIKNQGVDTDVIIRYDIGAQFPFIGSVPQISPSDIQGLLIPTMQGPVPLSTFTEIDLSSSLLSINHLDGQRVVTVSSDLAQGANTRDILRAITPEINAYEAPESVSIVFGGEAEDVNESFSSLGIVMLVGIFLIFGLLIWQFNSYTQPLYVLGAIPLAIIGVFPGLALMGQAFSFPGFIGVVALAGIVVNNAIILIDAINNNRADGLDKKTSVEEAASSRLQPILLTTITTVAGMMPLAFADPAWAPLAFSIIFGLLFSTVTTLFVVPILYMIFENDDNNKQEA